MARTEALTLPLWRKCLCVTALREWFGEQRGSKLYDKLERKRGSLK